jgi:HNH endonuclease
VSEFVPAELRELVRRRAGHRCEYCRLRENDVRLAHEVDHIVASKHRGKTQDDNLALACFVCNRYKGSDIASIDIETGQVVRLFNPRTDSWSDHFEYDGARIVPLTSVGRVTEHLLQLNRRERLRVREILILGGRYPG